MMAATRDSSWRLILFPKGLQNMHNDLPFFSERMKIEKCHKIVYKTYDKKHYASHIKALKIADW